MNITFFSQPAPHFGIPCQTLESRCQRGPTEVQPFSFADRDAMLQQKKQEKIERILEEERRQREFKAHPVPDLSRPAGVPNKTQVLAPTKVEPFQLQVCRFLRYQYLILQFDAEFDQTTREGHISQEYEILINKFGRNVIL